MLSLYCLNGLTMNLHLTSKGNKKKKRITVQDYLRCLCKWVEDVKLCILGKKMSSYILTKRINLGFFRVVICTFCFEV